MKSPFPGMDPYIEQSGVWADFHAKLIGEIDRALGEALPSRYDTRLDVRSYVVLVGAEGKDHHPCLPDVSIATSQEGRNPATAVTLPERGQPVPVRPFIEELFRERFIEIYEAQPERRLVTCLEILSPSNKRKGSRGWKKYKRKRQALLLSDVNLVEIDLLRNGSRMPMLDPWPNTPYTVLVSRPAGVPRCLVWPAHYREPLPSIPVPLTESDPSLVLDLQPLVDAVYRRARYSLTLDYSRPLTPPLEAEDANWLVEQLRTRQPNP